MKHLSSTSWLLSALVLLCGCGGGTYQGAARGAPGGAGGVTSPPPSPGPNIAGNWQFSMTSTVSGAPPLTIAGSISPSGGSVSGAVHVNGSNCFDSLSKVDTLSGSNLSLTSTPVAGQVATLTGNFSDDTLTATHLLGQFTGTYVINGGCAGGDEGNFTGVKVSSMTGNWAGDLTSETGDINRVVVTLAQGAATSEGTFELIGTAFFEVGTCFKTAKIASGTFPSGSVMGNSVSLEIETDNGVIVFLGTAKGDGLIRGNYRSLAAPANLPAQDTCHHGNIEARVQSGQTLWKLGCRDRPTKVPIRVLCSVLAQCQRFVRPYRSDLIPAYRDQ